MQEIKSTEKFTKSYPVLGNRYQPKDYASIDLSISNKELAKIDTTNPKELWNYIQHFCKNNNAKIALGGYGEKRKLYSTSHLFHNTEDERNIHLGIDLWVSAESAIFSPWDGTVFGMADNDSYLDYGPTLIIWHPAQNIYSLHGHLSRNSLASLSPGQTIRQSEKIAQVGHPDENGGWAPHLHYQLIRDLQDFTSDYPGVCSESNASFYLENCPDPKRSALGL